MQCTRGSLQCSPGWRMRCAPRAHTEARARRSPWLPLTPQRWTWAMKGARSLGDEGRWPRAVLRRRRHRPNKQTNTKTRFSYGFAWYSASLNAACAFVSPLGSAYAALYGIVPGASGAAGGAAGLRNPGMQTAFPGMRAIHPHRCHFEHEKGRATATGAESILWQRRRNDYVQQPGGVRASPVLPSKLSHGCQMFHLLIQRTEPHLL